ncbi:hypothetical protein OHA79_01905 [Streptomyces sp. NBC_00841]|uniref:hypothetical protein n=1 Tax=Streptomyces sp. NBC_00841 TaxID=2975847 RepID=UPI002DDA5E50|nr:hypothetical protein [Streptomyces sp. NBC_00841]WRZ96807.1 hypothetical protein OHA79_01905 [Streptomyces sp. NBC_00841]
MITPSIRTIRDCRLEEAGRTWDAVRVPRSVGLDALAILGGRSGAVLEDPLSAALYWFIARRDATEWDVAGTRVLHEDTHLVIPPDRRTYGPGPHWRICPATEAWTTDATALQAALEDAARPQTGQVQ